MLKYFTGIYASIYKAKLDFSSAFTLSEWAYVFRVPEGVVILKTPCLWNYLQELQSSPCACMKHRVCF